MNAPVAIPTPTLDELVDAAIEYGAVVNMAYAEHPTKHSDALEAAKGVQFAIDCWCEDHGVDETVVLRPMIRAALDAVLRAGRDEREKRQQFDLFETREIWEGAARHEARAIDE